jgi:predicted nucleic acid-binding protein
VALLDPSDRARPACRAAFQRLAREALVVTEAVITEASYLLDFSVDAQAALQVLVAAAPFRVLAMEPDDRLPLADLQRKYATLPMDYADATLVRAASKVGTQRILTLDRRDFCVYRVGRRAFDLVELN